jgi:acylglycerol lipase
MKESSFRGVGGLTIHTRQWQPAGAPSSVMVLVHGFNAHSSYLVWAGEQFSSNGSAAYALDLRGRGQSEGERFFVDKFQDYLDDLDVLVETARGENPGLPVYLLGHSAGGVIASSYAFDHADKVAGLICESFAFDVGLPHLVQLAIEGVGRLAPHAHLFKLKNADFTRDAEALARMNSDPLIADEAQPAETAAELLKAADRLKGHMPEFHTPVLIIHGTADKAALAAGSQYFYDHAGSVDKTIKLYDGHFHDLLNDTGKELVMADIQAWLNARVPVSAAAEAA